MISHELITHAVDLSPLTIPILMAFSKKVRREIWERDCGKCVMCGSTIGCECAHINHNKSDPNYNDASNGRLLCKPHHMWDHINRSGTEQLGLTEEGNDWAIMMIWKRIWGLDNRQS